MIHFGQIDQKTFLSQYWQKKPLLIKNALPNFICPLSPDELAGLALEEDFESRLITGSIKDNQWSLVAGVFNEFDFTNLPNTNWTLLVQGVDRWLDEVEKLIIHFNFIPRWRFDDVMISYAPTGGSVGPHFDFYDVFLLQGAGKRTWHIGTQYCTLDNYLKDMPLRIMDKFIPEHIWEVEAGDIVYVPPMVAHHGVSMDKDCMTLSFGYRAYKQDEVLQHLGYPNKNNDAAYYQDPIWPIVNRHSPARFNSADVEQAQKLAKTSITIIQFGCFITKLEIADEKILHEVAQDAQDLILEKNTYYYLHPSCRIAYYLEADTLIVFLNGESLGGELLKGKITTRLDKQTFIDFCNQRCIIFNPKTQRLVKFLQQQVWIV